MPHRKQPRDPASVSSSAPNTGMDRAAVVPQLPLGSNAFRSPLAAAQTVSTSTRKLAPIAILAVSSVLSLGLVAAAWISRPTELAIEPDHDLATSSRASFESLRPSSPAPRAPATAARPAAKPTGATVAPVPRSALPAVAEAKLPAVAEAKLSARAERRSAVRDSRRARRTAASAAARPRARDRSAAAAQSALPETPSRTAVLAVMTRVTPSVKACLKGIHKVAKVSLYVRGKTGRVTTARVRGVTGEAGTCIARAVRRAKFPRFQREQLEISYPFRR